MSQTRESFADHEGFVEKFKPKRTSDDCYTPPEVYNAVLHPRQNPGLLPWARHRTLDNESGSQSSCALRPATYSGGPSRIRTCNLGIMSPSR